MACFEHGTIVELKTRRKHHAARHARARSLRVTRGTVWITQEDDPNDVVLRAGDTWVVERDGLTIIEAQDDVDLLRRGPARRGADFGAPGALPSAWARMRDALAGFFATPTRSPAPYV